MLKTILAGVAALGLTVAPIAAQAGTRANASSVSIAPDMARVGSSVGEAEELAGAIPFGILVAIFGVAAAIVIAVAIEDNGGEVIGGPASPGTGN